MKILAINPGSTSTKIGIFENEEPILIDVIRHDIEELSKFNAISEQYEFRKHFIIDTIKKNNICIDDLDVVIGRGGLLKPIPGGVYEVNDTMIEDLKIGIQGEHASNLGGILAREISLQTKKKIPALIVDPVVVDELIDLARYSGRPELPRISIFHALNQKAVARRFAKEINKKYEDVNLIVAHLGGGITVGAHEKGRVIDVNNGLDGDGPFSPERTGTLPIGAFARLCFSGKYSLPEIRKMVTGNGGIVAYLGTNDARLVEEMAYEQGNDKARAVFEAMAYQIAKEIGAYSVVLKGKIDGILITGGIAYSQRLIDLISDRVSFIAPIFVYPGEDEMKALAESAYLAMNNELEIKIYK
jgi:butyrate kinase